MHSQSTLQHIARIVLGLSMVFAAIGHLTFQRLEFQAQVPEWILLDKDLIVILSGIIELFFGFSILFWKNKRAVVGVGLALFLIIIFPGNIAQYVNGIDAFGLDNDRSRLIRLFFQPLLIVWALWSTDGWVWLRSKWLGTEYYPKSIYDIQIKDKLGNKVDLSTYKGKTILIVNTASNCAFTPQYEGLEKLYQKYKQAEFEILAFPCNQFGGQEPSSAEDASNYCKLNYGISFPIMEKVEVNGKNAHPLFTFLKSKKKGLLSQKIKWNFTKFLIDKNGKVIKRFSPAVTPAIIEVILKKYL
jgi:glutathione peroxidase-family protein/uncharacterized membrane protein